MLPSGQQQTGSVLLHLIATTLINANLPIIGTFEFNCVQSCLLWGTILVEIYHFATCNESINVNTFQYTIKP